MWGYYFLLFAVLLDLAVASEKYMPFSPILVNTSDNHAYSSPDCWPFVKGHPKAPSTIFSATAKRNYKKNLNCIKLIAASNPNNRIKLVIQGRYFIEDSDNCKYDSLRIQDGPFQFSRTLKMICGRGSGTVIYSTGRYMRLVFKTDEYIERFGFKMVWTEEPNPDLYGPNTTACYFYIPITTRQGELEISERAAEQFPHNVTEMSQFDDLDCVWDIHNTRNSEMLWIWLHHISQQTIHKCSDRSIEIYSIKGVLFEDNPVESKRCYQVVPKIFPGSHRILIRVYAKDRNAFPTFTLNITTFREPIVGLAKCDNELYTCEDGRLCLDESLVCNGLVNCPDGDDESLEACEDKNGHSLVLQFIFGGATCLFLVVVVAVLVFSARRVIRRNEKIAQERLHGKETVIANLRPLRLLQQTTVRLITTSASDLGSRANSDRLSDIRGSNSSLCTRHSRQGSLNSHHGSSVSRHGSIKCMGHQQVTNKRRRSTIFLSPDQAQEINHLQTFKS